MDLAARLAQDGVRRGAGGPFGAVIVCDGAVIAAEHNRVLETNDPTAHAEILAIRAAAVALERPHLHGCELVTTCEPCPMCLAAAHWAHIDRITYAMTRFEAAAIGFDDVAIHDAMAAPAVPLVHHPHEESAIAFALWAAKDDRIQY
ncbi:MAG: nucleoside deaminase [Planctomycetota bacterium]|nr:nucleoside deaminase [Planctomycetota bacterium]